MYTISKVSKSDYSSILRVWEASVRATHHFLTDDDIEYYKPLILNHYLDAVELRCSKNKNNEIVGFLAVADCNLEMLFIHPNQRGMGIGKTLLEFAVNSLKVTKVDVNEQNDQAVGFYKHFRFHVIGRSPQDASGKDFPILHMELKN